MKRRMKRRIIYFCLAAFTAIFTGAFAQPPFDKAHFYQVMEAGNTVAIDEEIKTVEAAVITHKDAYSGALLMKKAGLIKVPAKKLSLFKEGHKKLEAVIEKDSQNAEWRLLRLIIQEHAPKILNYRSDKEKDAAVVHNDFKRLSPEVQAAVIDYRKHSDTLQRLNF